MNTLHLKYAVEVEKTGSITRAADNLYMGQPSLSKAIKELEEDLKIEIFRRSPKGMVPTEEGAEFLRYAKNILGQIEAMERISRCGRTGSGTISVCVPASGYLLGAVAAFGKEALEANVRLEAAELDSREILERVSEGKCAFGVLRFPENYEAFIRHYCQSKELKTEDIWDFEPVIVGSGTAPDKESEIREVFCKDFLGTGYEWEEEEIDTERKKVEMSGFYNCLSFLAENSWACMKSEPLTESLRKQYGLTIMKSGSKVRYKDVLVYSNAHRFTDLEYKLINRIYEWKNRISFGETKNF